MLIIIEGVDRTGKSTLAARLAELTGGEIIHASKPDGHPLREYETRLQDYVPGSGETLILDRWHIGERVWPQIFGRVSEYDDAMFAHTEMFLRGRGAVIIHALRTDISDWNAELIAFGEPIHGETAGKACDLFTDVMGSRYWNELQYNFKHDDIEAFAYDTIRLARRAEADAARIHDITPEYIGVERPLVLLVGERQNDGPGRIEDAPSVPFAPYLSTSGHFMLTELLRNDRWKTIGICNAYRDDGTPENLAELWQVLGRPTVIALGKKAERRVGEELADSIDVKAVPHPQYVRRFKRSEGPGYYAGLIAKEAAR